MQAVDGKVTLPDGQSYAMMVLPRSGEISLAALRRIALFVAQGVCVYGNRPTGSPCKEDIGLEAEYEKFVNDLDRAHKSFVTYFNEKKPGKVKFEMADSATTADYTLQITVTTMNVGNAGGFAWGLSRKAGGAQIEGTMQLVDNATGEVVCKFEFEKVKGLLAPVFKARAISVYRYLADELLKTVKK